MDTESRYSNQDIELIDVNIQATLYIPVCDPAGWEANCFASAVQQITPPRQLDRLFALAGLENRLQ